ncbi:MAG: hypothetical protein ACO23H_12075 [Alphaproteobacteria bacterium]
MKVYLGPYDDEERVIEVEVHNYDAWGADHTLSFIIVPVLQELRNSLHGAPALFSSDVPTDLCSYEEDEDWNKADEFEMNIFRTWENILDEMIWAFTIIRDEEEEDVDWERVERGCLLFGKFFRNLWD